MSIEQEPVDDETQPHTGMKQDIPSFFGNVFSYPGSF
jgi:hypothetical protein